MIWIVIARNTACRKWEYLNAEKRNPEMLISLDELGDSIADDSGQEFSDDALKEVINQFKSDLDVATCIVCHNVDFDKKIVGAEMIRLGMRDEVGKYLALGIGEGFTDEISVNAAFGMYVDGEFYTQAEENGWKVRAYTKRYDENGNMLNIPRHPILEDHVTVYSNASILGRITIGHDSVIGGNIWVTHSVPPYSRIQQSKAVDVAFQDGAGI